MSGFWSMSTSPRPPSRPVPDDRRPGGALRLVPLFVATALSVGLAAQSVPAREGSGLPGLGVGSLVAAMAIYLLSSIPARWASRGVVLVGAALMIRYGELGGAVTGGGSVRTLLWGIATAAALVLGARLESEVSRPARPVRSHGAGRTIARTARVVVIVGALVGAAALAFGPRLSEASAPAASSGDPADGRDAQSNPLKATDQLDMTQRPRLSERTVMRVRADRASFWRTSTFDLWSGRAWTRSDGSLDLVGNEIAHDDDDIAATSGEELTQRIRLESRFAELLPAAASPVSIESSMPLGQWSDGSLVPAITAVGAGTSYTVVSRQVPVTEASLRDADAGVPSEVLDRYASRPVATDRVVALASEITAGAVTAYDKVRAVEAWMGANTAYSQEAPLAPTDADVVDDFLFESKLGWCEQIASSLTVLLRLSGVPARLATGFVPGEWDPITRSFDVRESDAHAWTEVWFAGIGWVPFDPTADVPLAGEDVSPSDLAGFWWNNAALLLVAIAGIAALVGPVRSGLHALWRRLRRGRRRAADPARRGVGWVADAERRIEVVGERRGRARAPAETITAYASSITPDRELALVGARLDAAVYGRNGPDDADRAAVEQALAALEAEPVGEPVS